MKTKISRKEIQVTVKNAMSDALLFLNVESPSKKTKKEISRISKKFSVAVKRDLKKQRKSLKKADPVTNGFEKSSEKRSKVIQAS